MRPSSAIVSAISVILTISGCSDAVPKDPGTSFESTPAIAATELSGFFLSSEEIRSATGLDASGEPMIEGTPQKRGGDRAYPCAQMVAGPRDAAVIGGPYLGYRTVESSTEIQPRVTQTIALYPQAPTADDIFDQLTAKLYECRATPEAKSIVGSIESTATQLHWSFTMAGGSGLCGVDVRRVENVVLGAEVCGTGHDVAGASNVAERIVSKIRAA